MQNYIYHYLIINIGTSIFYFVFQETALVPDITIKETLSYFGWMYGLKGAALERRKQELYGFLEIPQENNQIKKLRLYFFSKTQCFFFQFLFKKSKNQNSHLNK